MSDSSSIEEIVNNEIKIIEVIDTDDALSTASSLHSDANTSQSPGTSKIINADDQFVNISVSHLQVFKLSNRPDFFKFTLGMYNLIERHLNDMEEGNQKKWLQRQIGFLKSLLVKNSALFQINEIEKVDDTTFIKKSDTRNETKEDEASRQLVTEEEKDKTECSSSQTKINTDDESIDYVSSDNVSTDDSMDQDYHSNLATRSKSKRKPPIISEGNLRRSQRIQNIPEDRKGICLDKLAYISAKLDSYISSSLKTPNTKSFGKRTGQQAKPKSLKKNISATSASETKNENAKSNTKATNLEVQSAKKAKNISTTTSASETKNENAKSNTKATNLEVQSAKKVECKATTSGLTSKKFPKQENGGDRSKKARKTAEEIKPGTSQTDTTSLKKSAKRKLHSTDA